MRPAPGETTGDVPGLFARARAAADRAVAELDLEATGTARFGDTVTTRWVLIHVMVDLEADPAFAEPPELPGPALRWGS